jgi:hypothetical protein
MYESLSIVTPPGGQAVDLDTAKAHCRVDASDTTSDALITLYLQAATNAVSAYLKQTLLTTQYLLQRDLLPNNVFNRPTDSLAWNAFLNSSVYPYTLDAAFKLLKPPLVSVDEVQYLDTSGGWQTLDPSLYVYVPGFPGRIAPAYGKIWPFTLPQIGSVKITDTAGSSTVLPQVQAAILLWAGSLYLNREAVTDGVLSEMPFGVKNLLAAAAKGFYR